MKLIQVQVKPNSQESTLHPQEDGRYRALLKSPPVDGKANAELIALVASHFQVPKSAVTIKSGAAARFKRVTIAAAIPTR